MAADPGTQSYASIYDRDGLRVGDLHCRRGRDEPADPEQTKRWELILVRRGVFSIETGRHRLFATANQMLFLAPDRPYRIAHPTDGGDECTVIAISPGHLHEWMERLEVRGSLLSLFDGVMLPVSSALYLSQHELLDPMGEGEREDAIMEYLHMLVRYALSGRGAGGTATVRTGSQHRRVVQRIQERIASDLAESMPLSVLSVDAGFSRFHLSRLFRSVTGFSVHQYRKTLRLREAASRLRQGEEDLTALALALGFSDHSHFTNAFRKEFGTSPASFRKRRQKRECVP